MKYLLIIWACLCTLFNLQAAEYSVVPKPLSVKETGKPALCLLPGQLSMSLRFQTDRRIVDSVCQPFASLQLQLKEVSSVKGKNGIVFDLSKKNRSSRHIRWMSVIKELLSGRKVWQDSSTERRH